MKFYTAKDAAERWNISPRRVTLLASQGRIKGAVPPDSGWLIPENAPKPEDRRRKGAKSPSNPEERYVFPFPLAIVNSQKMVDDFTPEERELYRLNLAYEEGNFAEARSIAEQLLHSKNPYIRLGALYQLPTSCMYLGDYAATDRYSVLFHAEIAEAPAHKLELIQLLNIFDCELVGITDYMQRTRAVDADLLPCELLPFYATGTLYCELLSYLTSSVFPEPSPYLVICKQIEAEGYYFYAMLMHSCLFLLYSFSGAQEKEHMHLRAALEIALEHKVFFTLAYIIGINAESAQAVLAKYPTEIRQRIHELSNLYTDSRNAYARHCGIRSSISLLTEDDYRLGALCLKHYSVAQMAEIFGLGKSGMNRRLGILYKKLGIKSKSELFTVYVRSALDWKGKEGV